MNNKEIVDRLLKLEAKVYKGAGEKDKQTKETFEKVSSKQKETKPIEIPQKETKPIETPKKESPKEDFIMLE